MKMKNLVERTDNWILEHNLLWESRWAGCEKKNWEGARAPRQKAWYMTHAWTSECFALNTVNTPFHKYYIKVRTDSFIFGKLQLPGLLIKE